MTVVALGGCRTTPLLSYLQALGVLRILHEQCAPELTSYWDGGALRIKSGLDAEALSSFFLESYQPTPILSPWNNRCATALRKGGGTGVGGKGIKAIGDGEDPRFEATRVTLQRARELLTLALAEGWTDSKGRLSKKPKTKKAFLTACRATLPDEALDWLDTATVLSDAERPYYPLILGGAGGVLSGSGDLSLNFLDAVAELLLNPKRSVRSEKLLAHALFGRGHPQLESRTVGQYAPGAAGTINSSAFEVSKKGVVNLWSFVLGMEGALIFASGVARRFSGSQGKATMPFTVSGDSGVGYSAASGETVKGEFWAPIWQRPMTVPELRRVIAEGRLSWRGKQATDGLDAAKALTTLGADRGLSHFERYVIAARFGDSSLAVPTRPFVVTRQPADRVSLLKTTDPWLARVRRLDLPRSAESALRRVDSAQMEVTQNPDSAVRLQDFLVELASLEWIVSRNPELAKKVGEPIPPLNHRRWGPEVDDGSREWRLAAALATQQDRLSPRFTPVERQAGIASVLLRPVTLPETHRKRYKWDNRPISGPSGSVTDRLAAAVIARTVLCADRVPDTDALVVGSGGLVAFDYAARVSYADVDAFLRHRADRVDDRRLNQLLSAAALLDRPPRIEWPETDRPVVADPAYAVLAGFYHSQPVTTPPTEENPEGQKVLLLPSRSWPQQLRAGRTHDVLKEALVRLQTAGFKPGVRDKPTGAGVPSPKRLLASLLIPTYVQRAINTICPPTEGE